MFKLAQTPTYTIPVTVELPGGEKHTFDAEFRRLPQSDVQALYARMSSEDISEDDLLARVLAGWDKVQDEDGQPLPFSDTNRARLLEVFPVRATLVIAWIDSLSGARGKNLQTPPASGRHG